MQNTIFFTLQNINYFAENKGSYKDKYMRKNLSITVADVRRGMKSKLTSLKQIRVDCSRQLRSFGLGLRLRVKNRSVRSDIVPRHGLSKIFR